jgi:LacI family transcriptional regulator
MLHPGYRAAGAYEMAAALIARPDAPTAVFTGQNLITIGALRALHHAALQHTIALAGFDDVELGDAAEPALTVVVQDAEGLGRAAAELLFARVDGFSGPARRVVLDTPLIVRGSGELPPR